MMVCLEYPILVTNRRTGSKWGWTFSLGLTADFLRSTNESRILASRAHAPAGAAGKNPILRRTCPSIRSGNVVGFLRYLGRAGDARTRGASLCHHRALLRNRSGTAAVHEARRNQTRKLRASPRRNRRQESTLVVDGRSVAHD